MENSLESGNVADRNSGNLFSPLIPKRTLKLDEGGRFASLDLFRGFIMIVMAWDHIKDMFADLKQTGGEGWSGEGPTWHNDFWFFFARFISDICAPGFFFTMGFGMVFFAQSRMKKQWTYWQIQQHFLTRSLVMFVVDRVVNLAGSVVWTLPLLSGKNITNPILNNVISTKDSNFNVELLIMLFLSIFEVMTALSLTMMFCSLILLFPIVKLDTIRTKVLTDTNTNTNRTKVTLLRYFTPEVFGWMVFLLCFILSNTVIVHYQYGDPKVLRFEFPGVGAPANTFLQYIVRFFLVPGTALGGGTFIAYPVIPWMGLTALGMGFAFPFKDNFQRTNSRFLTISVLFLILFVFMRLFLGSFGNLRGYPRGDGDRSKGDGHHVQWLIEFLWTCKYPPSMAYTLLTMSINFSLLYLFSQPYFEKIEDSSLVSEDGSPITVPRTTKLRIFVRKVLIVFGSVPLFYYIIHFWLISFGGIAAVAIFGDEYKFKKVGYVIFLWLPLLCFLYPLCCKYEKFKNRQPLNSWWRLL